MSTFGAFYQNGKIEPFFHTGFAMVTVSNIHSGNNRGIAIGKQNFMMQSQT